jgi:adenine C2-methylase RlmN of 23S rRNA A2503 and tRNA A37
MLTKDKIKDWITKMQIKWETNDKFRLPDVVYETYQKSILDIKEEIEKIKNITKKVLIEIFNEWEIDDDTQKWVFEEIDKELLKSLGEKE